MKIKIIEASKKEIEIIIKFQLKMAFETENLILNKEKVTKGITAIFNDSTKGKYYIAKDGNKIIASLLTTYEWSDWRNSYYLWIQSLYVEKEYRKKGIFKKMYFYLKNLVENVDYAGIRLYVDNTNLNAIEVYKKLNMDNSHYTFFEWLK